MHTYMKKSGSNFALLPCQATEVFRIRINLRDNNNDVELEKSELQAIMFKYVIVVALWFMKIKKKIGNYVELENKCCSNFTVWCGLKVSILAAFLVSQCSKFSSTIVIENYNGKKFGLGCSHGYLNSRVLELIKKTSFWCHKKSGKIEELYCGIGCMKQAKLKQTENMFSNFGFLVMNPIPNYISETFRDFISSYDIRKKYENSYNYVGGLIPPHMQGTNLNEKILRQSQEYDVNENLKCTNIMSYNKTLDNWNDACLEDLKKYNTNMKAAIDSSVCMIPMNEFSQSCDLNRFYCIVSMFKDKLVSAIDSLANYQNRGRIEVCFNFAPSINEFLCNENVVDEDNFFDTFVKIIQKCIQKTNEISNKCVKVYSFDCINTYSKMFIDALHFKLAFFKENILATCDYGYMIKELPDIICDIEAHYNSFLNGSRPFAKNSFCPYAHYYFSRPTLRMSGFMVNRMFELIPDFLRHWNSFTKNMIFDQSMNFVIPGLLSMTERYRIPKNLHQKISKIRQEIQSKLGSDGSKDQLIGFNHIVDNTSNHVIIGGAGSGKTYLSKLVAEYFKTVFGCVAVQELAMINNVAKLISGRTFHSFLMIPEIELKLLKAESIFNSYSTEKLKKLKLLKVILIDEVSLLDDVFLVFLDRLFKLIKTNPLQPFGGITIILSGDFGQMPPIDANKFFFQSESFTKGNFFLIYLEQVNHRAKDDAMLKILNKIRLNKPDNQIMTEINSWGYSVPLDIIDIAIDGIIGSFNMEFSGIGNSSNSDSSAITRMREKLSKYYNCRFDKYLKKGSELFYELDREIIKKDIHERHDNSYKKFGKDSPQGLNHFKKNQILDVVVICVTKSEIDAVNEAFLENETKKNPLKKSFTIIADDVIRKVKGSILHPLFESPKKLIIMVGLKIRFVHTIKNQDIYKNECGYIEDINSDCSSVIIRLFNNEQFINVTKFKEEITDDDCEASYRLQFPFVLGYAGNAYTTIGQQLQCCIVNMIRLCSHQNNKFNYIGHIYTVLSRCERKSMIFPLFPLQSIQFAIHEAQTAFHQRHTNKLVSQINFDWNLNKIVDLPDNEIDYFNSNNIFYSTKSCLYTFIDKINGSVLYDGKEVI